MCLWKMDAPGADKPKPGKIFKSYILTQPQEGAWDVSEVWAIYIYHQNFKFVSRMELWTNRQMENQTLSHMIWLLHAPARPLRSGHHMHSIHYHRRWQTNERVNQNIKIQGRGHITACTHMLSIKLVLITMTEITRILTKSGRAPQGIV